MRGGGEARDNGVKNRELLASGTGSEIHIHSKKGGEWRKRLEQVR